MLKSTALPSEPQPLPNYQKIAIISSLNLWDTLSLFISNLTFPDSSRCHSEGKFAAN